MLTGNSLPEGAEGKQTKKVDQTTNIESSFNSNLMTKTMYIDLTSLKMW